MGFFTVGGATLSFGDTRDPSSFPQYGNRWRGGQIVEEGVVGQQTDINTKQPILDQNGRAKEQLNLPLLCDGSGPAAEAGMRTDERNSHDHKDTGRRTLYIKGSLRYAVGEALRAVRAEDLDVGGYLFVMWTGMGKTGNSSFIGRTWQVHYIKPSGVFLNSVSHGAPGFQNQAPPAGPHGAMPMQQNAQGQYAPQQPVTAPPPQGWNAAAPSTAVNAAPPNPYGQHNPAGSPAANAAAQWSTQQAPPQPAAPPAGPWGAQGDPSGGAPMGAQPPADASNPWGAAPAAVPSPQAPYGPPAPAQQGTPAPPPAGNPWGQQ